MRILIFNWKDLCHPLTGGAEVYIHEVARRWADGGHAVTFFSAAVPGLPEAENVGGIDVIRRGSRLGVYREARRFWTAEGRGHYDIVLDIVNTRPFLTPDFVQGVPVVALIFQVAREVWAHEVPFPLGLVGRHWLEQRWLHRYRDVPVLTISESSKSSLEEYGLRNVVVVPVGLTVPPRPAAGVAKERRPTVLFVGRLASNKRPADALSAFDRARRTVTDAQMWVVGTGPKEGILRQEWESPSVRFFGRVSEAEKFDLMQRATALVVTSVREGWGMVVSEAAAVGTRAVAYDVPGLRDSVTAGKGILVAPNPDALAAALATVLPRWAEAPPPAVAQGGVSSWDGVAATIFGHLAAAERATTA